VNLQMNLAEALEIHARATPDQPAIVHGARQVTHGEFAARVRTMAGALRADGVEAGTLIGVCLKDTPDHLAMMFALARIGALMLPMDWRWTEGEKRRLVEHFRAAILFEEDDAPSLDGIKQRGIGTLAFDPSQAAGPIAPGEDLPLLLSLSSGTTGQPKGPSITHQQMLRRFWTHWINLGLNSNDRYVSATPLFFGAGRTFAMSVLFAGGTVVLFPPPFAADALCAEIERTAATSLFLVPTQLRKLLELPTDVVAPMQRLKLLLSSGSPLDPQERHAIRERFCANFIEYYASTEGGGISISNAKTQMLHDDSVGRPVFAVEVEAVDEQDNVLPPGVVGRLRYRGPAVATGYYRDEDPAGVAFKDGWFYPGDLAEINAEGYIFLRGRSKDMILRGGINIYPAEVEAILRSHAAVIEAAAIGRPSVSMGEEVAAFVTLRSPADADELIAWCKTRLASYKVPREVFAIDELPKNSSGKVLKAELVAKLPPIPAR
jgi:acyl-CoA synthetase (AMP-forming)/AMP-acid ligase II